MFDVLMTALVIVLMFMLAVCVLAIFLMATWMQVNEGRGCGHGRQTDGHTQR